MAVESMKAWLCCHIIDGSMVPITSSFSVCSYQKNYTWYYRIY